MNKEKLHAVPTALVIALLILALSFGVLLLVCGGIFYMRESDAYWLVYLIAAVGSAFFSCFFAAGRLPLRGIVTGLAFALTTVVLHSTLIVSLNPDRGTAHTMIILCALIPVCVIAGVLGRGRK